MAPATGNGDGQNTVFIDTSLDTHLATIVSDSDTVSDLKRKIMLEHHQCFPAIGDIKIDSLKVKRRGNFYHLSDSMLVKSAIATTKTNWFFSVDVSRIEQDSLIQNFDKRKAGDQLALPWVTDNRLIDQGSPSTHLKIVPVVNHVASSVNQFTAGDSVKDSIKNTEEDRLFNNEIKSKKRPRAVQNESLLEDASGSKPSAKKKRKTQKKETNVKASEALGNENTKMNIENSFENKSKGKDLSNENTRVNEGEDCSVLDQVAAVVTSIVEDIGVETCPLNNREANESVLDVEMVPEKNTQQEMPSEISQNEKDNELIQKTVTGNEIPSSSTRISDGELDASALGHGKGEQPSTNNAAEKEVPSASLIKEPDNINKDAIDPSQQDVGSIVQESAGDQIDNHKEDKELSLKQGPEVNVPVKKKKVKKSAVKKKDASLVKHDSNLVSDISSKVPAPAFSEKITDEAKNDKVNLSNAEKNDVSEKMITDDVIAKEVEISQPSQSHRSLVHVENMDEKSRNEFTDTVGSRKKKENVGRSTSRNDESVVKHTNDIATLRHSERKETVDIQMENEDNLSRTEENPSQVNAEGTLDISEKQNDKINGTKKKKKSSKTKKTTGRNEDESKTNHASNGEVDKSVVVTVPALNDHLHEKAKENETSLADADGKDGDKTKGKDAQVIDEGLSRKTKKNHKSSVTSAQDLRSKRKSTELELEPEKSQTIDHHHLPEETSKNLTISEVSNKMNEKGDVNNEADIPKDGSSEINFMNYFAPGKDATQSVEKKSKKKTKEPPVDSMNGSAIQSQKLISKNETKNVPTDMAKDPNLPNTNQFKTPKKISKIVAPKTSKSAYASKGHGEPSAESFLNQKSDKQQLPLGQSSVKTVKKSALVVNSSQNEKSLLNRPKTIFGGDSDESSADDNATVNSDSSTRTPSGKSSSSGDSATSIDSRRNVSGFRPVKRKEGGGKDSINSQSKSKKSMADLLRSSSRFKKARVTASQQAWDTESEPVDFVPESQSVA